MVAEAGPSGYAASFSADCAGSIANGQTKTCTVTNDDQAATLVVVKNVINDNGGSAVAGDFSMSTGGTNASPVDGFPGDESGTTVTLDAGSYNVTEIGPSGYAASFTTDCSGTITVGQTKTCTVTNDDQAATLVVVKHVVNDNGGSAVAGDFTLDSGGTNDSPDDFAGDEAGTTVTLDAGSYNVTEIGPSGYAASFTSDCFGTIANGETKTCTVTNDDVQPLLTVIKHVINDNGGTAVAGDFTMTVFGANPTPASFPGEETPGTTVALDAGSYGVSESGPFGYSGSFSAGCVGTIVVGETKTCTVTNDDQAATLTVIKHVINDNGGSAVAGDFTLNSGGTNDSPDNFAGEEAPGTTVTLDAGAYNVTENGPSGYTSSFSADCFGTITVGQTKTCTVTNDDQPATLMVVKHVINDNGGSAVASDFTMSVTATDPSPASFPGDEAGTSVSLDAGNYAVTETGLAGYTESDSADCIGTIANGETKTCTITNDDQPATLTVIKHVVNDNGGTNTAGDWTMSVIGGNAAPASVPGHEGGTTVTLDANSAYGVSESGPSGYTSDGGSADCSSATGIPNGSSATCTFTNDDKAATLIVIKHVINDSGGSAQASDFTLDSGGTNDSPDNFAGKEAPGTTVTLDAGAYDVTENGPSGYTASFSAGCTGSIASGETKTCTVTNDDIPPPVESQITPTGTTCSQFNAGAASTLSTLQYTVRSGKVNSVAPGVFFYWVKVTASAGSNTFTIDQSITTSNFDSHYFNKASGSNVFTSNCTALKPTPTITQTGARTTITFTAAAGTYVIGIKYDAASVKGFNTPSPTTVHYDFQLTGVPASVEGLDLVKKP
jgi:hypothetical protein